MRRCHSCIPTDTRRSALLPLNHQLQCGTTSGPHQMGDRNVRSTTPAFLVNDLVAAWRSGSGFCAWLGLASLRAVCIDLEAGTTIVYAPSCMEPLAWNGELSRSLCIVFRFLTRLSQCARYPSLGYTVVERLSTQVRVQARCSRTPLGVAFERCFSACPTRMRVSTRTLTNVVRSFGSLCYVI